MSLNIFDKFQNIQKNCWIRKCNPCMQQGPSWVFLKYLGIFLSSPQIQQGVHSDTEGGYEGLLSEANATQGDLIQNYYLKTSPILYHR